MSEYTGSEGADIDTLRAAYEDAERRGDKAAIKTTWRELYWARVQVQRAKRGLS